MGKCSAAGRASGAQIKTAAFLCGIIMLLLSAIRAPAAVSGREYEALRKEALSRERRIIWNNDGGDIHGGYGSGRHEWVRSIRESEDMDADTLKEEFLGVWTAPLAGTHVDTIFYCGSRGSFGMFGHHTDVGQVQITDANIVGELIERGTCPLKAHVEFARENGMEIFLSKRMNDTHDANAHEMSRFKKENPQYMLGTEEDRPPHGAWTAVDYAEPAVRDFVYDYLEEVCRNFEIDGIELDFFRHPVFFRHRPGEPVSRRELDMMTGLIRRIREMTEEVGREKGRPLLVAVRVPDSVEFCRAIGLDLERWLSQGLVDIVSVSGEWRMNTWEYSVELGHTHGVKVYSVLTHPWQRPGGSSDESMRGRAMSAWKSGVDGVYTFNQFGTRRPIFNEIGAPEAIAGLDKVYYINTKGISSMGGLSPADYINIPVVGPGGAPLVTGDGEEEVFELVMGGNLDRRPGTPSVRLKMEANRVTKPEDVTVRLNGSVLPVALDAAPGGFSYEVDPDIVRDGLNRIEVSPNPGSPGLFMRDIWVEISY